MKCAWFVLLLGFSIVGCEGTAAHRQLYGYDRTVSFQSTPAGVELYAPDVRRYGRYYRFGETPYSFPASGQFKLAAYKDGRIRWLDVDATNNGKVEFTFDESDTRPANVEELRRIGLDKDADKLQLEEDLKEGVKRHAETQKWVDAFKKELADAPDYKSRLRTISGALNTFYVKCDVVLDACSSAWSLAIDSRKDFNIALAELRIRLSARGILGSLDENHTTLKEAFDTVKEPPADLKPAYDALLDYYSLLAEAYSLAKNPSGSLVTFRQRHQTLESSARQRQAKVEVLTK